MPSLLVTPQTLQTQSRADVSAIPEGYLGSMCQVAHNLVRLYLGYDPAVQEHDEEEGAVQLILTGRERAMASLRLAHQPLLSLNPTEVLSALSLLYPAPMPPLDVLGEAAILGGITMWRKSGAIRVPFLGYGIANALYYQYGAASYTPYAGPTGYRASYTAGYRLNATDAAAYPQAMPVPPELVQAAAWLLEGLLAQGQRVAEDLTSAMAGELQAFSNLDYSEHYQRDQRENSAVGRGLSLLFGTQQGRWAQEVMDMHKRTPVERVLFV